MKQVRRIAQSTDIEFGERLLQRRQFLQLTRKDVASSAGISLQQLYKYEKGINRVSSGRLQQIATALDISVPLLLGSQAIHQPSKSDEFAVSNVHFSDEQLELNEAFRKLKSPMARKTILDLVTMLSEL